MSNQQTKLDKKIERLSNFAKRPYIPASMSQIIQQMPTRPYDMTYSVLDFLVLDFYKELTKEPENRKRSKFESAIVKTLSGAAAAVNCIFVIPVAALDSVFSAPALAVVAGQSISRTKYNNRIKRARKQLSKLKTISNFKDTSKQNSSQNKPSQDLCIQ